MPKYCSIRFRRPRTLTRLAFSMSLIAGLGAISSAQRFVTVPVGSQITPTGINDSGTICGYFMDGSHACYMAPPYVNPIQIPGLNGAAQFANGINKNGVIVGMFLDDNTGLWNSFRFQEGQPILLGTGYGAFGNGLLAVNDAGMMCGEMAHAQYAPDAMWWDGTPTGFYKPSPLAAWSDFYGINNHNLAVGVEDPTVPFASWLNKGGVSAKIPIPTHGHTYAFAYAVNDSDVAACFAWDVSTYYSYTYALTDNGGPQERAIDDPALGTSYHLWTINNHGYVAGDFVNVDSHPDAFLYNPNGAGKVTSLRAATAAPNNYLVSAGALNNRGQIAGVTTENVDVLLTLSGLDTYSPYTVANHPDVYNPFPELAEEGLPYAVIRCLRADDGEDSPTGGVWPGAQVLMQEATHEHVPVAGSLAMNFTNSHLTGAQQMLNALKVSGNQLSNVSFMAIVATAPSSLGFSAAQQAANLARIKQAILAAKFAGKKTVICTNGRSWGMIVGHLADADPLIASTPLWQIAGSGEYVDLAQDWNGHAVVPFTGLYDAHLAKVGPWTSRIGKQFWLNRTLLTSDGDLLGGVTNCDMFDSSLFKSPAVLDRP